MIYVFLPAYNEEDALPRVVVKFDDEFKKIGETYQIVVLDDGSQDGTVARAEDLAKRYPIKILRHAVNQGLGPAMVDGLKHVAEVSAAEDLVVTMDCDDTHEPRYMHQAFQKIKEGHDLVILSRYQKGGGEEGLSFLRSFLSRGAGFLLKVFFPIRGVKEYSCGYRVCRASILKKAFQVFGDHFVRLPYLGFVVTPEILIKFRLLGARIAEVPFVLNYGQKTGTSKNKPLRTIAGYFALIWLYWGRGSKKIKPFFYMSVLLAALFGQIFFSMQTKSPTVDEFAHHVASGYSHLVTGDFRMNPTGPPLPRLLSAIPLYFIGAKAPLDHWSWEKGDSPVFARQFFYQEHYTVDELIFWARLPIAILSVLFGYFVFRWARELFGLAGAFTALTLYVFCPDIVAHSGLATSDIAVAFFFYLTLWRFWKYLRKPNPKNMVLTGVMAGCAMISKFSAILVFPTLFLITVVTGSWRKISIRGYTGFLCVCLLTIWAGYFFELKPLLKNTPDPLKKTAVYQKIGGEPLVRFANEIPVPFSTFASAFGSLMITRVRGTNAFFMGEWSHNAKSWWNYYLMAFGIKNTIPFLILILLSFLWIRRFPADRMTKIFLFLPIVLFFVVTLRDKAQAGIRYFLPIYPIFFILCGGWVSWAWKQRKIFRFLIVALLSWHMLEAGAIYPDYLAYFNESIGGPDKGYLYLRDSNIDWGQDLKGLAEWTKKGNYGEIVFSSNSIIDLERVYGVRWRSITQGEMRNPEPYVYALSVHGIDSVAWSQRYKPVKIIGHSIWIYDLRHESQLI